MSEFKLCFKEEVSLFDEKLTENKTHLSIKHRRLKKEKW